MLRTLNTILDMSKERGYEELSAVLEYAMPQLALRKVSNAEIATENFTEPDTLYFCCQNLSDGHHQGNVIYFDVEAEMHKAAYQMMSVLYDSEKLWYEKVIETNLRFNDITLKAPDIITMIKYFNQLMQNPVIIYDEFFNISAITHEYLREYGEDETDIQRHELRNLFYYKQQVTFQSEDSPKKSCNRLLFSVISEGMWKGYLAIFDMETPYEDMDMMILEIFANSALTEMRRRLDLLNVEKKFISDFIYDVIYRKEDRDEIDRRAKRLRVAKDADYAMIAINPLWEDDKKKAESEFMNDRIMSSVQNYNKEYFEQDIVTKFNTSIYILHKIKQHQEEESYDQIKNHCGKIMKMLGELFAKIPFQIGIGEIVSGLVNVSNSFHQAWATISYGEILNGKKQSFIVCYADDSLLKLFGRLNEIGCLEEMIPENLRKICQYDLKNHTEFYETLKAYLNCNCNAKKAAEKIFVHYKTMLYRIEKIKNTFEIDLENSNSRLLVELGIQLLDIKQK